MKITTIDGKTVHLEATNSDARLKQHHEARTVAEARATKLDARLKKEKIKRDAALPTQAQRMEQGLEGLRKTGEKMSRQSDPRGDEVLKIVEQAVSELHEYSSLTRELEAKSDDPLGTAADKAGRELRKAVPSAFESHTEARAWALRFLPMTGARKEAVKLADARGRLNRARGKTAVSFWNAIQRGAVRSGLGVDDLALRHLVEVGQL